VGECLNLEEIFPAYRIRMSRDHEPKHGRDPWNFEIPCSRFKAAIYPHGGTRLQAHIHTRYVKTALTELEAAGASPWQVGDLEATVLFEAADFQKVAAVLRPHRKAPGRSAAELNLIRPQKVGRDEGQTGGSEPEVGDLPPKDEK